MLTICPSSTTDSLTVVKISGIAFTIIISKDLLLLKSIRLYNVKVTVFVPKFVEVFLAVKEFVVKSR